MLGEVRKLYYVGRVLDGDLHARLEQRHWNVEHIDPGKRLQGARRFDEAAAGILDFSDCQFPRDLPAIQAMLSISTIGWVATGHAEQVMQPDLRRLIRDFCFDYVTLPTSGDRL